MRAYTHDVLEPEETPLSMALWSRKHLKLRMCKASALAKREVGGGGGAGQPTNCLREGRKAA